MDQYCDKYTEMQGQQNIKSREDITIHSRCYCLVIMSSFFVSGRKILLEARHFWKNFLQTALSAGIIVVRLFNIKPREHTVCSLT